MTIDFQNLSVQITTGYPKFLWLFNDSQYSIMKLSLENHSNDSSMILKTLWFYTDFYPLTSIDFLYF